MLLTIALDGPVGAGKSSVADGVAQKLGILHLDTGAMYRAFAWKALQKCVALEDEAALEALTATDLPEVRYENGEQHTYMDGQDVTGLIRTPEVSMAASTVSKAAVVRRAMVKRQQELASRQSMLLDGRDIGTRVLPNATVKFYLTASPEIRARRRFDEMQQKGQEGSYEEVLADVIKRDDQDMHREVDPLRPAEDAQIIDSSYLTQEQVVDNMVRRIQLKQGQRPQPEEKLSGTYRFARGVAWLLCHIFMPVTYHGLENAQEDAPYILISNHNSMVDPILIAWGCFRYQIHFLGKKELESNPILHWFFNKLDMIPVDRHNMDMHAVRACLKTLKEGRVLGIFPEGTRHKKGVMEDLESGIAMIALRSKAPLVPAYMSAKPRLFRRIHLYYGAPIQTAALAEKGINKETCDELLENIRQCYRDMAQKYGADFPGKMKD